MNRIATRRDEVSTTVQEYRARITQCYETEMSACKGIPYITMILPRAFTPSVMNNFAEKNSVPGRQYPDFTKDDSFDELETMVFVVDVIDGKLVFGQEKRMKDDSVQFKTNTYMMGLLDHNRKRNEPSYEDKHFDKVWLYTEEGLFMYHEIMKKLRLKADRKTFTAMATQSRLHHMPIYVHKSGRVFDKYIRITQALIDSGLTEAYRYCSNRDKLHTFTEADKCPPFNVGDYLVCAIQDDGIIMCDCIPESEFKLHFTA